MIFSDSVEDLRSAMITRALDLKTSLVSANPMPESGEKGQQGKQRLRCYRDDTKEGRDRCEVHT